MRKSNYIFYLVVIIAFGAGMGSCKKNNTPTSYATNKTTLQATIDSLTIVYNNAVEGSKPGDYSVGAKEALDTALTLAGQVISSQTFTQQEVNNALNNLLIAGTQFSSRLLQEVSVANLVAFWKFNGNAIDSSGNGHDGTLTTNYVGSTADMAVDGGTLPQLVADRFGRPNMAYDFNNGATVEVPYSPALLPQNFTICLWLKRHSTSANNYMFSLDRWFGYKFQLQDNNFLFLTAGGHDQDDSPGSIDSADVWRHVAVSYTSTAMKFYIQGVLVKTAAITSTPATLAAPVDLVIGNELPKAAYNMVNSTDPNYFYGSSFFNGSLDEVRFYNKVLSDAEVLSIYTDESSL